MSRMKKKLVLFDIDGTLLTRATKAVRSVHEESFSLALKQVFGVEANVREVGPAGKTDKQIIFDIMEKKGVPKEKVLPKITEIFDIMTGYVESKIMLDRVFSPLQSAEELLERLEGRSHLLGLVTGNLEKIAASKLGKFGLMKFFSIGGFGDFSDRRSDLVTEAVRQAEKFGSFEKKDIFVVGDTPSDIECGKTNGVKTIAVSTGPFTFEELKKCNPDFIFEDFSDITSVIGAIES